MDLQHARTRLKSLLQQNALSFQAVTLASGRQSSYYLDCRQVTLDAEGAYLSALLLLDALAGTGVQAIGGLTLGADPIVAAVAALSFPHQTPLSAFIVRKEAKGHGRQRAIEGPSLPPRARVAIVDDVATSGGSLLKAIDAVRTSTDWQITQVLCLVDRQEGAQERLAQEGFHLHALFTAADLIQPPR